MMKKFILGFYLIDLAAKPKIALDQSKMLERDQHFGNKLKNVENYLKKKTKMAGLFQDGVTQLENDFSYKIKKSSNRAL
jgi:RNA binding exosome subunit